MRAGIALLLLAPLLAGCLGGDDPVLPDDPRPRPVLGDETAFEAPAIVQHPPIEFRKIHTPEEIVAMIDNISTRDGVTSRVIGDSIEGRPIHLVSVGEGDFDLWIQGRIHGNEPTGAEAIMLALDALTLDDASIPEDAPESFRQFRALRDVLLERLTFHFIPVANPDGAAAYQRGNAMGTDLNREFFAFSEPEPVHIMEAFWDVRPDGCLDLHNEGIGETDWDAFNPTGPMIEPEIYDLMIEDVWYGLLEVDAAGGRGGGPNEFYNVAEDAPVVGDVINPTAYHPGTHDMFCSTRGAPGYTPEGAIRGGHNGIADDIHSWSTRLHQVTIAAAAFHWAGFYDPSTVEVHKFGLGESLDLTLSADQVVLSQFVVREQEDANDYNAPYFPHGERSSDPNDIQDDGQATGPRWTDTAYVPGATEYHMALADEDGARAEARSLVRTATDRLVLIQRNGTGIHVTALADIQLHITDSFDPVGQPMDRYTPRPTSLSTFNGTVDERSVVTWRLDMSDLDIVEFRGPEDRMGVGPYRFTATTADGDVHMGVERVRNAPAGANLDPPQE